MATIYDIARMANVSAMTVSRVINKTGRVSEKTRVKVQKVMDELHYIPNSVARCLVTQESKIISLLVPNICHPFYTTIARGAEDAAHEKGYQLLLGNSDENLLKERQYVEMILSMKVDGVLFAASSDLSAEHLRMLEQRNVPYVLLDREVAGLHADAVIGDSRTGTRSMIASLIEMGHTRIGFINGDDQVSTARERRAGYMEALVAAGLPVEERLMITASLQEEDQQLLAPWFSDHPSNEQPTAVFAASYIQALSIVKEARRLGLRIPEDLSIVCFDELGCMEELNPFLSIVSQPAYEFGKLGFKMLHERIKDRKLPARREQLPCEIKIRSSVGSPTHDSRADVHSLPIAALRSM